MDALNQCRICLNQTNLLNIFDNQAETNISEKVMFCASVQIIESDPFPKHICETCKYNMHIAYDFINLCQSTNEKLLNNYPKYEKQKSPIGRHIAKKIAAQHPRKLCIKDDSEIPIEEVIYEETVVSENLQRKSARVKKKKIYDHDEHVCKICKKIFPFQSHLLRHINTHTDIKQFKCKYCGDSFKHRYNLNVHVKRHDDGFDLKCNVCNKGFASPSILKRHMVTHTKELEFKCQYCDKLFAHKTSLNVHETKHTVKSSYSCHICYKVFSYKSTLSEHMKSHLGIKNHKCSNCSRAFTRNTLLVRHMKSCQRVNDGEVLKTNVKYVCEDCGVEFMQRVLFNDHCKKCKDLNEKKLND